MNRAVGVEFRVDGQRQLVRSLVVAFAIVAALAAKALTAPSQAEVKAARNDYTSIHQAQVVAEPNSRLALAFPRRIGLP